MNTCIPRTAATLLFGMLTAAAAAAPLTPLSDTPQTLTTQFTCMATVPVPPVGTKALDVCLPVPSDSVWYPYAEADGKPLVASWTLTYHLPTKGAS